MFRGCRACAAQPAAWGRKTTAPTRCRAQPVWQPRRYAGRPAPDRISLRRSAASPPHGSGRATGRSSCDS